MTAGDTTTTECAQLPLDHSPSIKNRIECSTDVLSVISGSTSYLSRKGVFAVGLALPLSDLTDIVETMPGCKSLSSSAIRKAAWVSAMNKQLSERRGAEIQCMVFLKRGRHAHLHSEYCSSSFLLFFFSPGENRNQRPCIMLYFIPPKALH